ncbi:MAG: metallophosphoesterase [Planctomycetes bacterium]|nr:metallophosphoesterase [Planctomycetota bacterium]
MRTTEFLAAATFLALVAAVYTAAGAVVIRALAVRLRGRPAPLPRWRRWMRRGVLAAAGAGLVCMAYAFAIEPGWVEVTHVALPTGKVPPGRPIRVVHISDLHCEGRPRLERSLPDLIAAERPDAIIFTGDAMNTPAGVPVFRELMARLAALAPTYAVSGNWDAAGDPAALYEGTGVMFLDGRRATLAVGPARLRLIGVPMARPADPGVERSEAFTIVLHHIGDLARGMDLSGVDLFCAGHTHGGQIALPLWGPLVTLTRHGDGRGRVELGGTTLYVNRGIGMEGGPAPRVRFGARPEVTVYHIGPEQ